MAGGLPDIFAGIDDEYCIRHIDLLEMELIERSLLLGCDCVASVLEYGRCHNDAAGECELAVSLGHLVTESG